MESLKTISPLDIPVSALITIEDKVYGLSNNEVYIKNNHLFHAEILAISKTLKKLKIMDFRNHKATLHSTLEPCCMCLSFASLVRVSKIIYYAEDVKFGGTARIYTLNSAFTKPEILYIEKEEVRILLSKFFKNKR